MWRPFGSLIARLSMFGSLSAITTGAFPPIRRSSVLGTSVVMTLPTTRPLEATRVQDGATKIGRLTHPCISLAFWGIWAWLDGTESLNP
ncbi:hypothetical protein B0H63DRAFT_478364, partial [Podospora didyma]